MRLAISATLLLMTSASGAALAQGTQPAVKASAPASFAEDVWTYAEPKTARVSHVDLDLVTDFENKRLYGTAVLDVVAEPGAKSIVLDDNGFRICEPAVEREPMVPDSEAIVSKRSAPPEFILTVGAEHFYALIC